MFYENVLRNFTPAFHTDRAVRMEMFFRKESLHN